MKGWLVIYVFPFDQIMSTHYQTEKMAVKFANDHRALGWEAFVINVDDMLNWINTGVAELEAMFKL